MYGVGLYARVRRSCHVEGMSIREAARVFGIDRRTVAKMLAYEGQLPVSTACGTTGYGYERTSGITPA